MFKEELQNDLINKIPDNAKIVIFGACCIFLSSLLGRR